MLGSHVTLLMLWDRDVEKMDDAEDADEEELSLVVVLPRGSSSKAWANCC